MLAWFFFLLPFINKGPRQKAMERRPRTMIKVMFTAESSLFSSIWGCVCSPHERWLKLIWIADDKAAQSLLNKLIRSNLVNTTNQVEVLQRDPNSPLYSVKSFEELRLWVWLCSSFNRGQTSIKLFCGVYFSFSCQETSAIARSVCHGFQQALQDPGDRVAHDARRTVRL